MATMEQKSFDAADETRTPEKTVIDIVDLGPAKTARVTLQPGWRWSECIKPVAGTDTCQVRHLGVVMSGHLHVVHDDGSEMDLTTGNAYLIEPGHEAWVVGDEAFSGYEFESTTADTFARPS